MVDGLLGWQCFPVPSCEDMQQLECPRGTWLSAGSSRPLIKPLEWAFSIAIIFLNDGLSRGSLDGIWGSKAGKGFILG